MVTDEQLTTFCHSIKVLREEDGCRPAEISFERARLKARIVVNDGGHRSAWGFVDLATGNILKADGWKAAARQPRGNISNGVADCGPFGPVYIR